MRNPKNLRVPIGTNIQDIIDYCGGFKDEPRKIISGGPMMGFALFDLNVPTTKTASALLCMTQDEVSAMEPSPCINCGKCAEVCPTKCIKLVELGA